MVFFSPKNPYPALKESRHWRIWLERKYDFSISRLTGCDGQNLTQKLLLELSDIFLYPQLIQVSLFTSIPKQKSIRGKTAFISMFRSSGRKSGEKGMCFVVARVRRGSKPSRGCWWNRHAAGLATKVLSTFSRTLRAQHFSVSWLERISGNVCNRTHKRVERVLDPPSLPSRR